VDGLKLAEDPASLEAAADDADHGNRPDRAAAHVEIVLLPRGG
jgi:hypothetical protein